MSALGMSLGQLAGQAGDAYVQQREFNLKQQALDKQVAAMQALNNYRVGQLGLGQQRNDLSAQRTDIYGQHMSDVSARGWGALQQSYRKIGLVPNSAFDPTQAPSDTNMPYVGLTREQMSPVEQQRYDIGEATKSVQQAQAEYKNALTEAIPEQIAIRRQALQVALGNLNAKLAGLELSSKRLNLNIAGKAGKGFDAATDADARLQQMYQQAQDQTGASDKALLFNHIAMTLGAVKGGRVNQAEIESHLKARSLPENLMVAWDQVQSGRSLSPQQRINFLKLGTEVRESMWDQARREALYYGQQDEPAPSPDLPPVKPKGNLQPRRNPGAGAPSAPLNNKVASTKDIQDAATEWNVSYGEAYKIFKNKQYNITTAAKP